MIALLCCALIVGVFLAGHWFAANTVGALVLLGAAVIMLGVLVAAAETRGIHGEYIPFKHAPSEWHTLWLAVIRLHIGKEQLVGAQTVYVQTPSGTIPITGVFTARMNSRDAIVFDTTAHAPVTETPVDPFPSL